MGIARLLGFYANTAMGTASCHRNSLANNRRDQCHKGAASLTQSTPSHRVRFCLPTLKLDSNDIHRNYLCALSFRYSATPLGESLAAHRRG